MIVVVRGGRRGGRRGARSGGSRRRRGSRHGLAVLDVLDAANGRQQRLLLRTLEVQGVDIILLQVPAPTSSSSGAPRTVAVAAAAVAAAAVAAAAAWQRAASWGTGAASALRAAAALGRQHGPRQPHATHIRSCGDSAPISSMECSTSGRPMLASHPPRSAAFTAATSPADIVALRCQGGAVRSRGWRAELSMTRHHGFRSNGGGL